MRSMVEGARRWRGRPASETQVSSETGAAGY